MRKISLIPVFLIILIGLAFAASTTLFPATGPLARFPVQPGTIGNVLSSLFESDGTAKNTTMLSGVNSSGYLQNNNCTHPINNVWKSIDANGRGSCGSLGHTLAVLGNISDFSGTVQLQHMGSSTWEIATIGTLITEGDLVSTDPDSLASITFSDSSIIRLNTDTTVEISVGTNTTGDVIAQIILDNGELWGRVLTSTGINFGNKDWIAGVRGTSLSMEYDNMTHTGILSIVDSTNNGGTPAAVVRSQADSRVFMDMPIGSMMQIESPDTITSYTRSLTSGSESFSDIDAARTSLSNHKVPVTRAKSLDTAWIRENTKKDIVYLATLSDSGTLSAPLKTRVDSEITVSMPRDTTECSKMFMGAAIQNKTLSPSAGSTSTDSSESTRIVSDESIQLDSTDFCNTVLTVSDTDHEGKKNTIRCALWGRAYWQHIGDSREQKCQDKSIVAIADYTNRDTKLYFSGGRVEISPDPTITSPGIDGISITGNQYISYPLSHFPEGAAGLAGKRITITIGGSTLLNNNGTLIDFGKTGYYSYRIKKIPGSYVCTWLASDCLLSSVGNTISFTAPGADNIRHFVLGNILDNPTLPFGGTFQKVVISN